MSIVAALVSLWAPIAPAQQRTRSPSAREEPRAQTDCAAYGAGFVKVAGSDVCVRVGGRVEAEGGARR